MMDVIQGLSNCRYDGPRLFVELYTMYPKFIYICILLAFTQIAPLQSSEITGIKGARYRIWGMRVVFRVFGCRRFMRATRSNAMQSAI